MLKRRNKGSNVESKNDRVYLFVELEKGVRYNSKKMLVLVGRELWDEENLKTFCNWSNYLKASNVETSQKLVQINSSNQSHY